MKKNLKNFIPALLFVFFTSFRLLAKTSEFLIPEIEKFLYELNNNKIISYKISIISPKDIKEECTKPKINITNYIKIHDMVVMNLSCENKKYILRICIKSYAEYYIASTMIRPKSIIEKNNIKKVYGNINELPNNLILSNISIIGKIATRLIGIGQPITINMIRSPWKVYKGDKIFILFIGNGFYIRYNGISMQNATTGDILKIKLPSGKILQGILNQNNMLVFYIK
ncbi:MAG: flagellar basal body P-ring formation chaperone FlgA [Wigglesworthia glossinidia]|nr:flagellar basal body P-ring formation chaperone FlgA [Wigglesworthia glossinidia]